MTNSLLFPPVVLSLVVVVALVVLTIAVLSLPEPLVVTFCETAESAKFIDARITSKVSVIANTNGFVLLLEF
jgi:hypothetical protein